MIEKCGSNDPPARGVPDESTPVLNKEIVPASIGDAREGKAVAMPKIVATM
jgi:hypothetical protein